MPRPPNKAHEAAIKAAKEEIMVCGERLDKKKPMHKFFDEQNTLEKWHDENALIDEHHRRMAAFLSSIPPQPREYVRTKKRSGRR